MQVPTTFYGVDVSKDTLEVAQAGQSGSVTLANEHKAIDAWLRKLPQGCAVAVESTGAYHQLLVQRAHRAGVAVYVLNAKDVYHYAKTFGARAKTDRLDAQVIAQYLAERHAQLRPHVLARSVVLQLDKLLRQRSAVVDHQVALRLALKDCPIEQPLAQLKQAFAAALELIDQQIARLIEQDEQLRQDQALLRSVTGFGAQSSALLAGLLDRLQFANSDALVAYAGLDPRANDSGTKKGKRRLSKRGPPHLRRAMYLVAFAACHSRALKPFYLALKARGLASTEALNILARKLLRAAYAVWKTRQPFDPARLGRPMTA
jgi:transposase